MKTIHMLTSIGGTPTIQHGDIVEVSDEIAAAWIAEGMAELYDGPDTPRVQRTETTTARPDGERAVSRGAGGRTKKAGKKAGKKDAAAS